MQTASTTVDDVRLSLNQREMLLAGGGFGEPIQMLALKERAKHSNFGGCNECSAAKLKWAAYRTDRNRTLGDAESIKREVFKHVHQMKLERQRCMEFHQMCSQHQGMIFEYDDKCGSQFLYLPSPRGGRFSAADAGYYSNSHLAHARCCPATSHMYVLSSPTTLLTVPL